MPSLLRQRELLRLEYEYEKAAYRREVEASGVERRVKRGDAWFPVSVGRHYYNSLDRLVVEITMPRNIAWWWLCPTKPP